MVEKLKNVLFYAGADRTSIKRVAPSIRRSNRVMLRTLSAIATLLIGVMLILSFYVVGLRCNRIVYLAGTILSALVFLTSFVIERYVWLLTTLVYLTCLIYYAYGIFLGTITEPEGKTVTFIVMLVIMPILFIERPMRIVLMTVFYDVVFISLCYFRKTGMTKTIDIVDGVLFGILGIASGMVINQMKVKSYINECKLREISRIDQLTGVNNRNAYGLDLFSIPEKCRYNLACVYIDVNGLHEVNNSEGHESGDEMLKFVAIQIKNVFSRGDIYRTGGDEFVIFIPDMSMADLGRVIVNLIKQIEVRDYHIAVGYETMGARYLVLDELIKAAEMRMFIDKNRYYKNLDEEREVRNN